MLDASSFIGTHDLLLVTLDTLRYDVARDALARGQTPNLARVLPGGQWEERHSPGTFTYAAHEHTSPAFSPRLRHQGSTRGYLRLSFLAARRPRTKPVCSTRRTS